MDSKEKDGSVVGSSGSFGVEGMGMGTGTGTSGGSSGAGGRSGERSGWSSSLEDIEGNLAPRFRERGGTMES